MIDLPPPPPVIMIERIGDLWRVTRSDGLFEGLFVDRRLALREAADELDAHHAARDPEPLNTHPNVVHTTD